MSDRIARRHRAIGQLLLVVLIMAMEDDLLTTENGHLRLARKKKVGRNTEEARTARAHVETLIQEYAPDFVALRGEGRDGR